MKNKNLWLYILVGGVAVYYISRYFKNKGQKNFYGFLDDDGGGNRGRGTKVEPRPADEPVYTSRRKGKS